MLEIFTIHTTRQFFYFLKILFPFRRRRRPLQPTGSRLMSESNEIMLTDR